MAPHSNYPKGWLARKPVGHWHSFKRGSQLHRASHLHLHNFFATKRSNLSLLFSIIFSQLPKKLELLIIAQRKTANSKIGQSKCCSPQVDFVNLEIPGDDQNTEAAQPPIWQTWLRSNISSKKCSFESPGERATSAKSGCLTPVIFSVTGGVVCCLSWFGDFGNPKLQIPNCPFSGCLLLMIVVIVGDDVDSWWW